MSNQLFGIGAEELEKLALARKFDPFEIIDELARRISNRRDQKRADNPVAVRVYVKLSRKFNYSPLRPLR